MARVPRVAAALSVLALALACNAAGPARAPLPAGGGAPPATGAPHGVEWSVESGLDEQIFPSATISTATSKNPFAFLAAKVANVPVGSKIRVAVRCDALLEPSSSEVVVVKDSSPVAVPIKANWKFAELAHIRQQIPVNLTYTLFVDGQEAADKTDTAIVHSVNDCLFGRRDAAGKTHDFRGLFAAYVNEDNPKIDELLKSALKAGIVKQFDGYQEKNPRQVALQVLAIWHTLQMRGVKYSDITDIPDKSSGILAQHVRFPDESIDNAQANCVDGSVLFASVLQKIGIESALVVKPDHMFVMFYTGPGRKGTVALETTMLGKADLPRDPRNNVLADLLEPQWRSQVSASTFAAAIKTGDEELTQLAALAKKQTAANSDNPPAAGVINIPDARKAGIMPVPYDWTKSPR